MAIERNYEIIMQTTERDLAIDAGTAYVIRRMAASEGKLIVKEPANYTKFNSYKKRKKGRK